MLNTMPPELIDMILFTADDYQISLKLKRYYISRQIFRKGKMKIMFPSHLAITSGNIQYVRDIYKIGIKFQYNDMALVCVKGNLEMAKFIHSIGILHNDNDIHRAYRSGKHDIAIYLNKVSGYDEMNSVNPTSKINWPWIFSGIFIYIIAVIAFKDDLFTLMIILTGLLIIDIYIKLP
jgi:hypothetical protein